MNSQKQKTDNETMKKLPFVLLLLLTAASATFAEELFKSNVTASYYADKFHGKKTSSGETFNMYAFTAAHKTLPFNTIVKVTNLENVRINDRGPFAEGREIDVSRAAAEKLNMLATGTAQVSIEIVQLGEAESTETSVAPSAPVASKARFANDPNKKWDIQLGAFAKRENAEALGQKLVDAGFQNVVFQKTSQVTRVVIKDIATANVQDVLTELERKGFTDYFVRERKADSVVTPPSSSSDTSVDAK